MMALPMKTYKTGRMVVDWKAINKGDKFKVDDAYEIEIVSNQMLEKIAKVSGNKRKERRLEVKIVGYEAVRDVGTESFKNLRFMKALLKLIKCTPKTQNSFSVSTFVLPDEIDMVMYPLLLLPNALNLFSTSIYEYEITDDEIEELIQNERKDIEHEIEKLKIEGDEKLRENAKSMFEKYEITDINESTGCNTVEELYHYFVESNIKALEKNISYHSYHCVFSLCSSLDETKKIFRRLSKKLHTDLGGNEFEFVEMKRAYDEFKEHKGW